MLLDTENRTIETSGVMQVAKATIKTSPKIFSFFADQTYANKPRAITRELSANAVDSHVLAGKPDLPIEIWLPTLLEPTFRVRDFGLGMSHEFMMTSFMCYADGSTKDQSNQAIGGFGIGSKSPFAYVDQYTVVSRFDGTESVYSIFKDEDGIPAIGLLGQRPTDQPNGVEVAFPVKPEDFETFEKAAFEALRFFEPLPIIKNAQQGAFALPEYISRGDTWAMRPQEGDLAVIMGGIRYPVSADSLTYKFPEDSPARRLLKYGLDLRLPIGSCSVALSREHLSYDDRTIAALRDACENVIDEVAASFSTMFDHIEHEWEARVALYKQVGGTTYSERGKFLAEHAKWHGEPLETTMKWPLLIDRQHPVDKSPYQIAGYEYWSIESRRERRGKKGGTKPVGAARWEGVQAKNGFLPGLFPTVIIDDLPQSPKHKAVRKIKDYAESVSGKVLVIRPWDREDIQLTTDQIIAGFGHPEVVLTSTMPEPINERGYSRGRNIDRPKVRMFTFDGSNQPGRYGGRDTATNINPGQYGRSGVTEVPYLEQPRSGILVVLDKFDLPRGFMDKMKYGLIDFDELYFVNAGDAKKLKKADWHDWLSVWHERKAEKLAAYPELPTQLALADNPDLRWLFEFIRRNPLLPELSNRTPLGKVQQLFRKYVAPLTTEQRALAPLVVSKLPAGIKPDRLLEDFKTKQPKANRLISVLPNVLDQDDMNLFVENLR